MLNPTSEKCIKIFKSQSTNPFTLGQEKNPFIVAHVNSKTKNPEQIQVTRYLNFKCGILQNLSQNLGIQFFCDELCLIFEQLHYHVQGLQNNLQNLSQVVVHQKLEYQYC